MAEQLTTKEENYSQWYNDLVINAGLAENSSVRGCMVIKPYGYAIWENIQKELDRLLKRVEKPGRYIGGEGNSIYKDDKDTDVAFLSAEHLEDGTRTFKMIPHAPELTSFGLELYEMVLNNG